MTTTSQLPLTLPAAALAVGDTVPDEDWPAPVLPRTVTSIELTGTVVLVAFDDEPPSAFLPSHQFTVTSRRPIPALNDLTTALTALVEQWDRMAITRGDQLADVTVTADWPNQRLTRVVAEEGQLRQCADEVREILGRLA